MIALKNHILLGESVFLSLSSGWYCLKLGITLTLSENNLFLEFKFSLQLIISQPFENI
jgi:hypothetical protein